MINVRESEIREESLSLTVAAYQVLGSLTASADMSARQQLVDDSFRISSLIAEAFSTCLNQESETAIRLGLAKILELKVFTAKLKLLTNDGGACIDRFIHLAEELQVELIEFLSEMAMQNAENYSPKLEIACF